MKKRIFSPIVAGLIALSPTGSAQDLLQADSKKNTLLIDNEHVRVFQLVLKPKESTPQHSLNEFIVYAITGGHLKVTLPDGAAKEVNFKAGSTLWNTQETRVLENIGTEIFVAIYIELKGRQDIVDDNHSVLYENEDALPWTPAPMGLGKGIRIAVLDGSLDQAGPFTARFFIPAGSSMGPHRHATRERMTIISGSMYFGYGEKMTKDRATLLRPGGYVMVPAERVHFGWVEEDTVVQVHGIGPWKTRFLSDETPKP